MLSPQRIWSLSRSKKSGSRWRDLCCQFRKPQNKSMEWSRWTLSHFPSNECSLGTLSCTSGNHQGSGSWGKSRGMELLCGMICSESRLKPTWRKHSFDSFCGAAECTQNFVGVNCLWKDSCKCTDAVCVCC